MTANTSAFFQQTLLIINFRQSNSFKKHLLFWHLLDQMINRENNERLIIWGKLSLVSCSPTVNEAFHLLSVNIKMHFNRFCRGKKELEQFQRKLRRVCQNNTNHTQTVLTWIYHLPDGSRQTPPTAFDAYWDQPETTKRMYGQNKVLGSTIMSGQKANHVTF